MQHTQHSLQYLPKAQGSQVFAAVAAAAAALVLDEIASKRQSVQISAIWNGSDIVSFLLRASQSRSL